MTDEEREMEDAERLEADRAAITALLRAVPPALVDDVLTKARAWDQRVRSAPAWLMVYFSLALWLWPRDDYEAVFVRLADGLDWAGHYEAGVVPRAGSLSRARVRLGPEPVHLLFQRLTRPPGDAPLTIDTTWLGTSPRCEFPGVQVVTLTDPGCGLLVDAAWAPGTVPGHGLRDGLLARLDAAVGGKTHQHLIHRVTGRGALLLRSTWADGVAQEIWGLLCVRQALAGRLDALDDAVKDWGVTDEENKIVRMYDEDGLTIRAITEQTGGSYGYVQRVVSGHGTPRPRGARPLGRPECGTKKAHQWHLDHGEKPDEACKQANRAHVVAYDRRTGYSKARNRAYRRLACLHVDVFGALRQEEEARAEGEQEGEDADKWRKRARERAARRLAKLLPDEFDAIFAEERQRAQEEARAGDEANR